MSEHQFHEEPVETATELSKDEKEAIVEQQEARAAEGESHCDFVDENGKPCVKHAGHNDEHATAEEAKAAAKAEDDAVKEAQKADES